MSTATHEAANQPDPTIVEKPDSIRARAIAEAHADLARLTDEFKALTASVTADRAALVDVAPGIDLAAAARLLAADTERALSIEAQVRQARNNVAELEQLQAADGAVA